MKINYNIPTTKEDITLQQYIIFDAINSDPDLDENFKLKRTLEIFCSIPFDKIELLKQTEIDTILSHLLPLLSAQYELHPTFTFDGVKYGLIPNFSKDLLAGEFIDLDVFAEQKEWLKLMSILYRPITFEKRGQYLIEPYSGSHTNFKDLPFHYFLGCLSFFLNLFHSLAEVTQRFTEQEIQNLTSQLKDNSKWLTMDINT
ncbi:MAG: hypothetical protein V4572_12040 [Bacteroidota bacterium]